MFTQEAHRKRLQSVLTGVIHSDCKVIKNNLRMLMLSYFSRVPRLCTAP